MKRDKQSLKERQLSQCALHSVGGMTTTSIGGPSAWCFLRHPEACLLQGLKLLCARSMVDCLGSWRLCNLSRRLLTFACVSGQDLENVKDEALHHTVRSRPSKNEHRVVGRQCAESTETEADAGT